MCAELLTFRAALVTAAPSGPFSPISDGSQRGVRTPAGFRRHRKTLRGE